MYTLDIDSVLNASTWCYQDEGVTPHQLYLQGIPLDKVPKYKYLGVIITSDLSWSEHIQSISMKSNKLLGLHIKLY